MALFLGIDIGTSGTKVLLIDETGAAVASQLVEHTLSTPRPLWAEQDPAMWWNATVSGTRALLEMPGVDPAEIKGIGLSGQMHGSVFVDRENRVLRPAILWNDQRTQAECDWLTEQAGGHAALARLIGNQVLTGFTASKIVWLRNHEPEVYAQVVKVLLPKDYIRYLLTGTHVTDVSDASGTALFDVVNRRWSDEMLAAGDIPRSFMPDSVESPEITGYITPEASRTLGIPAGIPVVGGAGDQAAGAVGCGVVETGIVSSTIGTSGIIFAHSDTAAVDPEMRTHTFCHAVPGKWHVMGVQLSGGGSMRWLRDTFYPGMAYADITEEASTVPPGSEGLIYLPYLTGERTPYADPYARGTFFGITLRHTRAHFARALMEGVVYGLRSMLEIFTAIGVPMTNVRASGGGAKSPLWRQINADIVGREHVTLTVDEGPALGVALLAAVGTGVFASVEDACRAAIKINESVMPKPENEAIYNRFYPVYHALYPALKEQFEAVYRAETVTHPEL